MLCKYCKEKIIRIRDYHVIVEPNDWIHASGYFHCRGVYGDEQAAPLYEFKQYVDAV